MRNCLALQYPEIWGKKRAYAFALPAGFTDILISLRKAAAAPMPNDGHARKAELRRMLKGLMSFHNYFSIGDDGPTLTAFPPLPCEHQVYICWSALFIACSLIVIMSVISAFRTREAYRASSMIRLYILFKNNAALEVFL
jgi:hypothetical protein